MSNEDLLAACIDEIESGECSIEECLARHPDLSDELRSFLEIAQCLQSENVAPSLDFKARARSRLLEEIAKPVPVPAQRRWAFGWLRPLAPAFKPALAASVVVMGLSVVGGTTIYAAQGSLPQDSLYPVKRSVENFQLVLTPGPEGKARFNSTLAQRRVEEVVAEAKLGRPINTAALDTAATHIDAAVKEIAAARPDDVKSLLGAFSQSSLKQQLDLNQVLSAVPESSQPAVRRALDVTRRANLIAEVAYANSAFLSTSPSVQDDQLEAAHFSVDGAFLGTVNGSWNVGGVLIQNVNSSQSAPNPNERVHVEGLVRHDETFISEVKHQEDTEEQVVVTGKFQGVSQDGQTWRVGGIPVSSPQDTDAPDQGIQVQVKGTVQDHDFVGTTAEKDKGAEMGVMVQGTLVGANPDRNTIALNVIGSTVVINLHDASIQDGKGNTLAMPDLASWTGSDVKASGLKQQDGILSAQQISVITTQRADAGDRQGGPDAGKQPSGEDNKGDRSTATPQATVQPTRTPTPRSDGEQRVQPTATPRVTPTPDQDAEHRYQMTPTPTPSDSTSYREQQQPSGGWTGGTATTGH